MLLFCQAPARHLIKQADVVIVSEKKRSNSPTKIAPMMLVATKGMANKMTDSKMVSKIPVNSADRIDRVQHATGCPCHSVVATKMAR